MTIYFMTNYRFTGCWQLMKAVKAVIRDFEGEVWGHWYLAQCRQPLPPGPDPLEKNRPRRWRAAVKFQLSPVFNSIRMPLSNSSCLERFCESKCIAGGVVVVVLDLWGRVHLPYVSTSPYTEVDDVSCISSCCYSVIFSIFAHLISNW